MADGLHENFKIISNGRDLPFPLMRILGLMFAAAVAGYVLAVVDVMVELNKRCQVGCIVRNIDQ